MRAAWFEPPRDVVAVEVCRLSGALPGEGCRNAASISPTGEITYKSMVYTDYFVRGTEPHADVRRARGAIPPVPGADVLRRRRSMALGRRRSASIRSSPCRRRRVSDRADAGTPPCRSPRPRKLPDAALLRAGASRSAACSVAGLSLDSLSAQSYPTAKLAAPTVHAHFAKHLGAARARGRDPIAALPTPEVIERMINATFWASLRREEGYVPKISMAFLPPEHTEHPMMLEQPAAADARRAHEGCGHRRACRHPPRRLGDRTASCASGARRTTFRRSASCSRSSSRG